MTLIKKKCRQKRRSRLDVRLNEVMSRGIYRSLKANKKHYHWELLVDYNLTQLKRYLKRLWEPGMTWNNYGSSWHIDHIIPLSAFNISSFDCLDFKRCWSLKNLRPMWSTDNLQKHNKLLKDFQMGLAI